MSFYVVIAINILGAVCYTHLDDGRPLGGTCSDRVGVYRTGVSIMTIILALSIFQVMAVSRGGASRRFARGLPRRVLFTKCIYVLVVLCFSKTNDDDLCAARGGRVHDGARHPQFDAWYALCAALCVPVRACLDVLPYVLVWFGFVGLRVLCEPECRPQGHACASQSLSLHLVWSGFVCDVVCSLRVGDCYCCCTICSHEQPRVRVSV